jgi:heme oxygenase
MNHTAQSVASPATAEPIVSAAVALREHTADDHHRAERSDFQRRFVSGRLPRAGYTAWLEQMWWVYRALAAHFAGDGVPAPHAALFADARDRTPDLAADLAFLGSAPGATRAVPATDAFLARIAQWAAVDPPALLGVLYVLEGSTNGSRYIANAVRKAYGLDGGSGTAFLDPYGEAQPARWKAFKRELDAAVSAHEVPSLIAAARETFNAVGAMGAELVGK